MSSACAAGQPEWQLLSRDYSGVALQRLQPLQSTPDDTGSSKKPRSKAQSIWRMCTLRNADHKVRQRGLTTQGPLRARSMHSVLGAFNTCWRDQPAACSRACKLTA